MFQEPYEILNPGGKARGILVCDHASNRIPTQLNGLGLDDEAHLTDHIAWDIGAGWVARELSKRLDMRGVVCGYSRLLIDCNRQLDDPSSIPEVSDGVPIPGNQGLSEEQKQERVNGIFRPYHDAISSTINQWLEEHKHDQKQCQRLPAIFSIHSMTPKLKVKGEERPWEVSVLWHSDRCLADALEEYLCKREEEHGYCVGNNEPYSGILIPGYTTPTHGLARGLPHVIIEIRNDKLQKKESAEFIVDLLADAFVHAMNVCCGARTGEEEQHEASADAARAEAAEKGKAGSCCSARCACDGAGTDGRREGEKRRSGGQCGCRA